MFLATLVTCNIFISIILHLYIVFSDNFFTQPIGIIEHSYKSNVCLELTLNCNYKGHYKIMGMRVQSIFFRDFKFFYEFYVQQNRATKVETVTIVVFEFYKIIV